MDDQLEYPATDALRSGGLARWLPKGGRRRAVIRATVVERAAGRCERCGGDVDMRDGRSPFGGTYALVAGAAHVTVDSVRLLHRGCVERVASAR